MSLDLPLLPPWHADAACAEVGPGPWDSVEGKPGPNHWAPAKAICDGCSVRDICLEDSLIAEGGTGHSYREGVRGGLTPRERARLATDRRKGERGAA